MLASDLRHLDRQLPLTPRFRKAIDFLRRPGIAARADGRVDIDGDDVFAIVQRYETAVTADPRFECHRAYIDIQFIVSGAEVIGWAPAERMRVTEAYEADRDIAFGAVSRNDWTPVLLKAGEAAVLWPEDGHAPKLSAGSPGPVMKVVVKVKV